MNWKKLLGVVEKVAPVAISIAAPQVPAVAKIVGKVDEVVDRVQGNVHKCQVPCTVEQALGVAFAALKDSGISYEQVFVEAAVFLFNTSKKGG